MTHVMGHVPNGSLAVLRIKEEGIKYTIEKTIHVHGYLHLDNGGKPDDFRILLINNLETDLPAPGVTDRRVGFHLGLFEMPKSKNKKPYGIAFDIVNWADHQMVEGCIQKVKKYKGKRVEDIDANELEDLANDNNQHFKEMGVKDTKIKDAIIILKQSAAYMKSEWFKKSRAGDDPSAWIKENVSNFEDIPKLFGEYTPKWKFASKLPDLIPQ